MFKLALGLFTSFLLVLPPPQNPTAPHGVLGPAPASTPSISVINSAVNDTGSTGDSIATTTELTIGTGQLVAVLCGTSYASPGTMSVSDGTNTYTAGPDGLVSTTSLWMEMFYAINTSPTTNYITCNFTNSIPYTFVVALQIANLNISSPLDTHIATTGTCNSIASGNITTSHANEIILGAVSSNNGGPFTAGSNFTMVQTAGDAAGIEYWITSTTQSGFSVTASHTNCDNWGISVLTFHQ